MEKNIEILTDSTNPSKPNLLDSFARANDEEQHEVQFRVNSLDTAFFRLNITYLAYESDAPHMLLIGDCSDGGVMWGHWQGIYDSNRRSGSLTRQA